MRARLGIQRAIIVVLDGLRPDAIADFGLEHMESLMARGASSYSATTVAPSLTAAAMTSLMTGVSPKRHGIISDRPFIPRENEADTQVVVVGVATSFGVESTARHAHELGLNVTLAVDAMTDLNADAHANSVTRIFPTRRWLGRWLERQSCGRRPNIDAMST